MLPPFSCHHGTCICTDLTSTHATAPPHNTSSHCATPPPSHHASSPNVTSVFMQSPSTPSGGGTGQGNQVLSAYCAPPAFNAQQSAAMGNLVGSLVGNIVGNMVASLVTQMASCENLHTATGFDLYSAVETTVPARGRALIATDLQVGTPPDTYARVASRSSMALKGLEVGAGVVDSDARAALSVLLINGNDEDYKVYRGDRVAQLIQERIGRSEAKVVESLENTARGTGGFGSTGR